MGCLARRSRRGDRHNPNSAADFVLMFPKNFAQTPASAIADDGFPYAPGSNKASANGRLGFGTLQNAKCKHFSTDGESLCPNALEFRISRESMGLRKTKTFLHLRDFNLRDRACQL
jgi:hypothetical protein